MCPNVAVAASCLVLWTSVLEFFDVSSRFQSQSGFCFICILDSNIMYITWDPPLVLHIANLLMVNIMGQQFQSTAQCRHLLAHFPSLGLELNPGHMHRSAQVLTILNCFRDSVREIRGIPRVGVLQSSQPYERHHRVHRQRARRYTGSW